ncbi:MAG: transporter substrate-binding domain-containing protein [Candidatus Mcinerneyibacterium aminivorans]|uniref:Transporter substrate-binding domain-containing protein n=1 Tax=Candidatus Mcinerneyibacterium aminivorans TaxID=2703815 RepID=A0A5D0MK91_9BACT|nr:MAG: transporter substrate-binding domain-containing protein [Candidatus Mcinerneyibacterium aminivorans]
MRKILIFLSILIFISLIHSRSIRVVTDNYPPYNYREEKEIIGLSTEVVKEVLKRAGLKYSKIEMKPWPRIYKIALYKKNVLIYSIAKTEKRIKKFNWVGKIAPFNVFVYSLKNRNITIDGLSDLSKYTIGAVKDDIRAQYLIEKGLKENIEYADNDWKNILKLTSKRVDVMLNDNISMNYRLKKRNIDRNKIEKSFKIEDLSNGLYMALSRDTSDEIVEKCKKALEKLKNSGGYKKIIEKYIY